MHKQFYFLSPVEVVKVTPQNMEEVAEWCGGKVAQVESRRQPGKMDKYVWVPTPKGSTMPNAYPGMYVTKRVVVTVDNALKVTFSVFRKDYFDKNYFDTPNLAVDMTWERAEKDARRANKPVPSAPKKPHNDIPVDKLMGPEYNPTIGEEPQKVEVTTSEKALQKAVKTIEELFPGVKVAVEDGNGQIRGLSVVVGTVDETENLSSKTLDELQALYTSKLITIEQFREHRARLQSPEAAEATSN